MADPVLRWRREAQQAEQATGIPASVLLGLTKIESGGIEGRTSSAGAGGLTQFMPGTAKSVGVDIRPGHALSQLTGAGKYLVELGFKQNPELALKKYNAGPGNPGAAGSYGKNVLAAAAQYKGVGGGDIPAQQPSAGASGGSSGAATPAPDLGPAESILPLLEAMTQKPQAAPSMGVQAPAFSAQAALPGGYQSPMSGGGPAPKPDVGALLSAIRTVGGDVPQATAAAQAPQVGMATAAGTAAAAGRMIGGGYPTGRRGKIIGVPHQGTHTLGNWQSDNAVDISVPVGTPMVAADSGVVVKVSRHPQGAGRFAGDQVTIRGANGNSYFYAHGVAGVKAGERVKRGEQIGTTGSANGVAHLHWGVEKGDPRRLIGQGR